MKVSSQRIEDSQVVLNIEVEPGELEESLKKAYQRLNSRTSVPGFRKGKVPRPVLERYIGRSALLQDALDHLVPEVYNQAVQEQGIDAIDQPQIDVLQTEPVLFKATVPIRPTIELGDYHQLRLDPDPVEVTEAEVDSAIEQLRSRHALLVPVERASRFDDWLTLDVEGRLDGNSFLSEKGVQYHLVPDSSTPVPGFGEQLEGMAKGEEKEFSLSFPPDHPTSELAGKECFFQVAVSEIKERRLPELNDEFAKSIGDGFETVDALREEIRANLTARAEEEVRRQLEERVVDSVVELAQVEFPTILVDREVNRLIAERMGELRRGEIKLEDYLRDVNKTEEELKNELQPLATRRVTRSLVLSKVAELEKIEVSTAEIDAEIDRIADKASDGKEELRKFFSSPGARESLEEALHTRKTLHRLVEIATGETSPN